MKKDEVPSVDKYLSLNKDVVITAGNSSNGIDIKDGFFRDNLDTNKEKIILFLNQQLGAFGALDVVFVKKEKYFSLISDFSKGKKIHYLILKNKLFLNKKEHELKEIVLKKEEDVVTVKATEYLRQYLSNKPSEFSGVIYSLKNNSELFDLVRDNDSEPLYQLKEHLEYLKSSLKDNVPSDSNDYDSYMDLEQNTTTALQFVKDLEKLNKIL